MGAMQPIRDIGTVEAGRPLLAGGLLAGGGLIDVISAWARTRDDPFAVETGQGVYRIDITAWAWLHVAVGVVVAVAGLLAATGRRGTVPVAVGCAALAVALDLLLFPYAPVRALLVVALDGAAARLLVRHRWAAAGAPAPLSAARRPGRSSPDPPPGSPTRSD
ncbi:DUF7144 family membrane protein [Micromonospora sp. DT47]|uniref:DUF7144 family membrane protein n=1 Tax=Micromonospora sp. DT47 TaxID=3393431 RepID=UPI003CFB848A